MKARKTTQRQAIMRALERTGRPMGPREVLDAARVDAPELGIATVYRNLKNLLEARKLQLVQIPGQSPRYELFGKEHHHHFRCRSCDQVFEVEGCPGDLAALAPKGFSVEDHEVVLYGRCATCVKPTPQSHRRSR
jgi:Fur family ferric uptake transcriptional regulator